jgi:hypothetical protein
MTTVSALKKREKIRVLQMKRCYWVVTPHVGDIQSNHLWWICDVVALNTFPTFLPLLGPLYFHGENIICFVLVLCSHQLILLAHYWRGNMQNEHSRKAECVPCLKYHVILYQDWRQLARLSWHFCMETPL